MEEFLTTIGLGTFSRVMLTRRTWGDDQDEYHAMKIMSIKEIIQLNQVTHVNDERTILSRIQHPLIVRFFGSYRDRQYLYLSMEYLPGGELFSYFRREGHLKQSTVRFYACEMILALEYLHQCSIVYRDLKLENLVLDRFGHVKLTDFGFAKYIQDRTFTLCGTPEYLAPEMILATSGHSFGVDWYALGIVIYELLIGHTPFAALDRDNHPAHIYLRILHAPIEWPSDAQGRINRAGRSLIRRLLERDRTRRLGCMIGGVKDIKEHRWFENISWTDVIEQRIPPPIRPQVDHPGDTQNFELFREELFQAPFCTPEEIDLFYKF